VAKSWRPFKLTMGLPRTTGMFDCLDSPTMRTIRNRVARTEADLSRWLVRVPIDSDVCSLYQQIQKPDVSSGAFESNRQDL